MRCIKVPSRNRSRKRWQRKLDYRINLMLRRLNQVAATLFTSSSTNLGFAVLSEAGRNIGREITTRTHRRSSSNPAFAGSRGRTWLTSANPFSGSSSTARFCTPTGSGTNLPLAKPQRRAPSLLDACEKRQLMLNFPNEEGSERARCRSGSPRDGHCKYRHIVQKSCRVVDEKAKLYCTRFEMRVAGDQRQR